MHFNYFNEELATERFVEEKTSKEVNYYGNYVT